VDAALADLGMARTDLSCAYCDGAAEEWDHINPVNEKRWFSGWGHRIRNFAPCCRSCNGRKDKCGTWRGYLQERLSEAKSRGDRAAIEREEQRFARFEKHQADVTKTPLPGEQRFRGEYDDLHAELKLVLGRLEQLAVSIRRQTAQGVPAGTE
jgi:hypothetical protein